MNTTALLKANRKTLQGLHAIAHMDFQQPYVLIEHNGKFTYKSIMKELLNVSTDYYNVFVLYRDFYPYNGYRLARLCDGKFEAQRSTIYNYETAAGYRWIDTSVGQGDFEKARKSESGHYFIIAQEKQYENYHPYKYDPAGRFKLHYWHKKLKYATPYDRNSDKHYDNIIQYYDKRTFDKSGYIQQINNYPQRVRKIKAERSEAAASVWDGRQVIREFEDRIEAIHDIIRSHLFARTIPDYTGISDATRQLQYAVDHIRRLKENRFTAIEDIQREIRWTNDYISKAENRMKD